MKFADPTWLWLAVAAVPLLVFGFWLASWYRSLLLRRLLGPVFAQKLLLPPNRWMVILNGSTYALGVVMLCLALARPLLDERMERVDRLGIDFLVAVDVSKSMLTEDIQPNRMEASRRALQELLQRLRGDRMGLLAFAGEARMIAPMTFDSTALEKIIDNIDEEILWLGGTNLSEVIQLALEKFNAKGLETKALVLISDGEDLEGDAPLVAREAFLSDDIRIFTIGVGTPVGAKIPIRDFNDQGQVIRTRYIRGPDRRDVVSALNEETLTRIAEATGGQYYRLNDSQKVIDELFLTGLRPLARRVDTQEMNNAVEGYRFFLIPAVLLFLVQPFVSPRTRHKLFRN